MRTFQRWRASRPAPHSVTPRLISMIVMLGIVLLVMWQARDPKNWRWLEILANEAPAASGTEQVAVAKESATTQPPTKPEAAAEPFEIDPLEVATAEEEYLAISDGTTALRREEMSAYWRMFGWVQQQSLAQLQRGARSKVVFNDFVQSPDQQRGKLFALELNVRRVLAYDAPENPAGIKTVYEVWGWTNESRAWPYVIVTAQLPPGMPVGATVQEEASFAGYFFKVQGYHAGGAGPKDKPLIAPLMIGRLSHRGAPAPAAPAEIAWSPWIVGLVLVGAVWLSLRILIWRMRRKPAAVASRTSTSPSGEGLELAGWLAAASGQSDQPSSNSNGKHQQR